MLRNLQLRGGVMSFFFMFLIQAGLFFTLALFLSVTLGVSAVETGVRLLPLSLSLLLFAVGVPKLRPNASPRRVVRLGFIMLFAGLLLLVALLDVGVGPGIVTWPLLLAGSGLGMMASQLGAVTVSAVPDEKSGEVGGLQNTGTQLGASIGTALAGAVLISTMTASFFTGIENNPNVPDSVVSQAHTQLAGGVPFMSEARHQGRAAKGERAPRDRRRDRQGQQTEPDRRPARRGGHPRAARARCAPVHPRDPDRPTRRPSQAQTIPGIATQPLLVATTLLHRAYRNSVASAAISVCEELPDGPERRCCIVVRPPSDCSCFGRRRARMRSQTLRLWRRRRSSVSWSRCVARPSLQILGDLRWAGGVAYRSARRSTGGHLILGAAEGEEALGTYEQPRSSSSATGDLLVCECALTELGRHASKGDRRRRAVGDLDYWGAARPNRCGLIRWLETPRRNQGRTLASQWRRLATRSRCPAKERLTITSSAADSDGELLAMEAKYAPGGSPPPEHYHPTQQETFTGISGTVTARIGGVERTIGPGETVTVAALTNHAFWNPVS